MVKAIYENVRITGMAASVPKNMSHISEYTNELGEDYITKFIKTTGVETFHFVNENQTTLDLCYAAAKELLHVKNIEVDTIDAVVFVTQTPDYRTPGNAHVLHKLLNLKRDCIALDINSGCSGYVYGLFTVANLLNNPAFNRVLLLAGDIIIKNSAVSSKDRMLFGDAGTATIVEKGDDTFNFLLKSDGSGYATMITPGGGVRNPITEDSNYELETAPIMIGDKVFEFVINEIPKTFKEYFELYDTSIEAYDYGVLHQANKFMISHVARKIKLAKEKMPLCIDKYGNTSSATIPLTIVDLLGERQDEQELKLINSGFGIGLSWGIVDFKINSKDVLPIIYSDEYFEEAFSLKK